MGTPWEACSHGDLVTELRRPDPTRTLTDRWSAWREQLRSRRQLGRLGQLGRSPGVDGSNGAEPADRPGLHTDRHSDRDLTEPELGAEPRSPLFSSMIAVGLVALVLGSLWAWQSWSQRSAVPIDDLLPRLAVTGDEAAAVPDQAATGAATAPVSPGSPAAPAVPPVSSMPAAPDVRVEANAVVESGADQTGAHEKTALLVVHVSGAVRVPGVVELIGGARAYDAVEAAGGPARDADLDRINLAAPVTDGERIYVPEVGEGQLPSVLNAADSRTQLEPEPVELAVVDINAADERMLESLPGVGPATAAAIVQTRRDRGPFRSVEELLEVPGIGEAKLARLRPHVVVR